MSRDGGHGGQNGGHGLVARSNMRPLHRLRELRERAGLSQKELADRAGVLKKTVATLENDRGGRAQPGTTRKIAEALKVRSEVLYEGRKRFEAQPFTVLYWRGEQGSYFASCVEIPTVITQGHDAEEARETLKEATRLLVKSRRDQKLRQMEGRPDVSWEPFAL